jgi:hypothetical protein
MSGVISRVRYYNTTFAPGRQSGKEAGPKKEFDREGGLFLNYSINKLNN